MNPYHNVTDVRQRETFLLQSFNLFDRTNNTRLIWLNTFTGVFQHRQRVQWDIRARPRIRCRREVIGVGFASYFKDGNGQFFSQRRAIQEPFGIRPDCITCFAYSLPAFAFSSTS